MELIRTMYGCGCSVIATVHGSSVEEVRNKVFFRKFWEEKIFQNIFVLSHNEKEFGIHVYQYEEDNPCYSF